MKYPVVLFDLFRTVVVYEPGAPTNQVGEAGWRGAMLAQGRRLTAVLGDVDIEAFLDALLEATVEIGRERGSEQREVAIEARYERALRRVAPRFREPSAAARDLAAVQLEAQMVRAVLPKENARVLRTLATDRRLGLVSNFDHSASVRGLLCRLGLDQFFSSIVISIEQGRRKPHPEIFRAALNELGAVPRAALFVGDNLRVDVGGAQAAGIDAAWLNPEGGGADPRQPEPRFVIRQLADLHAILDS